MNLYCHINNKYQLFLNIYYIYYSLAFTSVTEASDAGLSIKTLRSPMLPFRSGSTGSKNSRLSANSHFRNTSKNSNRPKYTANTLNNISSKRPTPPKKKSNRPRWDMSLVKFGNFDFH